jgi:Zn-dependent peptidase ImmA (M78 family)/transcriptional regulator with XRE-family HTH domain
MTSAPRLTSSLFDGNRLRQARLYHGWRKAELARALQLTPGVIGQYEQGRTKPSPGALAALALHLGFPVKFFERQADLAPHVAEGQAYFRRLRSTSKLQRDRLLVRLELLAEVLERVERHIRLPAVDVPLIEVEEGNNAHAELAAGTVRAGWGLGSGPIDNVVRLLEAKGVIVVRPVIGTDDVDAFSTWAARRPLVVLGSDKDDAARSRFDAAHELGHLVMHHDAEPGHQALERQAHRFAAAFLMPAETIRPELPSRMNWPTYFDLKVRWRVSLQALLYRARSLGVLSADAYQRAQISLSRNWGREVEPVDLGPPEQPVVLKKALELMEVRLSITKAAIADEVGFSMRVLDDLLNDVVPPSETRLEVPI